MGKETERTVKVAYVVKYALTRGIVEVRNARVQDDKYLIGQAVWDFYGPREWAETLEEAQRAAEALRQRRLESLRKQVAALEAQVGRPVPVVGA